MKMNLVNQKLNFRGNQPAESSSDKNVTKEENAYFFSNDKGTLIRGTQIPGVGIVKQYKDFSKDVFNASKGKGTDYTVGKLNDTAVQLASLGIAFTLAKSAPSQYRSAMEFVGMGTWFAGQLLWPKMFALPIKHFKGVDPNLQYKDAYGRTKRFYEDPQYLCWEYFTPKEIDKIGDKLKVPKNIPNRREAIQEKAKQVSIQTNTLWMLTAGITTPLLSSLIADQLRVPAKSLLEKINKKMSDHSLKNIENTANTKVEASFSKILEGKNETEIRTEASDFFKKQYLGASESDSGANHFNARTNTGKKYTLANEQNVNDYIQAHLDNIFNEKGSLKTKKEKLKNLYIQTKVADKLFKAHSAVLGDVEGSAIANSWGSAPEKVLKAFGLSWKETKSLADAAKHNEDAVLKILVKKFKDLQEQPGKLDKFIVNLKQIKKDSLNDSFKVLKEGSPFKTAVSNLNYLPEEHSSLFNTQLLGKNTKTLKEIFNETAQMRVDDAHTTLSRIINVATLMKDPEFKKKFENDKFLLELAIKGPGDNDYHDLYLKSQGLKNDLKCTSSFDDLMEVLFGHLTEKNKFAKIKVERKEGEAKLIEIKEVKDFIKDTITDTNGGAKELSERVSCPHLSKIKKHYQGKGPLKYLKDAAIDKNYYNNWRKTVWAVGASVLVFSAIIIANMGKKNEYNPDTFNDRIKTTDKEVGQ